MNLSELVDALVFTGVEAEAPNPPVVVVVWAHGDPKPVERKVEQVYLHDGRMVLYCPER